MTTVTGEWTPEPGRVGTTCGVCGGDDYRILEPTLTLPVQCSVVLATAEEARDVARGPLELAICRSCGFIWNAAFDPSLFTYTDDYDNSLFHSPLYRTYAEALARRLVDQYGLAGRTVIEVGCGKGDFLVLLRQAGAGRVIGIDPSFPGTGHDALPDGVSVLVEEYSERHGDLQADAVICRQTLEHVTDPLGLLRIVRRSFVSASETMLYLDVPNADEVFFGSSGWDLIYPHANYFKPSALAKLAARAGFDVCTVGTDFEGQVAYIEATASSGQELADGAGEEAVATAATVLEERLSVANGLLSHALNKGLRVALWGAGARATTFLNLISDPEAVGLVVDLNPAKQGRYLPGTGHLITDPSNLSSYRPDLVILVNPIYKTEIEQMMRRLGVPGELAVV